jgi:hypothetical protein
MSHKDASAKQTQDDRDHFNHFDAPVLHYWAGLIAHAGFKIVSSARRNGFVPTPPPSTGPDQPRQPVFPILRRLDRRPISLFRVAIFQLNRSRIFAFRWAWLGYPAVSPRRSGQWPRASAPVQRNICPQHIHSFERRNPPSFTDACCARIHRLARVFNSGAPARPALTKPFLPPDEAVFVGPRKRPETGPAQHRRHGQTMRFDHVRVPEPALSCVLQSPLARDAKTIFGQLAPRPSTPSRGAIS